MSTPNDNILLTPSLNPLKFQLTSISSLFQSQRTAWRHTGEHTIDPALASVIRGPMEDAGQLLIMIQDLLRKLIDLVGIKLKQLEIEARTEGKECLGSQTDTEETSKLTIATKSHRDYRKLITKAWANGLNILPEMQERFDVMRNTLKKPNVPKSIEEQTPSLMQFIQAAMEINDRVWALVSTLVDVLKTVDEGLAIATVAVIRVKYPKTDTIAQERYGAGWLSDYGQELGM